MNNFSISQIAQFSGIKPHTIRIWEKRYNALNPDRSKGNTRYYNGDQLRRLLNIASLMDYDYKVSELCTMSDKRLFDLVGALQKKPAGDEPSEYFISQLIAAGMSYDEAYFEKIFSHSLLRYGMKDTYTKVMYPMLVRLGLMWTSDALPPVHEHFISNIIRQKMLTAIDSLPPAESTSDTWLLFLPENEFHENGLLLASYLIRSSGKKVIYLGGNVPLQSLSIAVEDINPANLLLFLVRHDLPENIQTYLSELSSRFNKQNIYLSGKHKLINQLNTGEKIHWLKSVDDLEQQL
ncbi:MAG TPA: MerR family transcriptional regulator [Balneolaceae bacterium]